MKTYKLPIFGIIVKINGKKGKIKSDLHMSYEEYYEEYLEDSYDDYDKWLIYENNISLIENIILSHACSGVNILDNKYVDGINSVVQKIIIEVI